MSSSTRAAGSAQPLFASETAAQTLQERTLAAWTLLSSLRAEWAGKLILCCGLGPAGSAVALAANVAGAACLAIEPDAAVSRMAMRAGVCDFFVNTVDEALRGLKNEIRQRKPLSVALELDMTAALAELVQRGVLPVLFAVGEPYATEAILRIGQSLGCQVTAVEGTQLDLAHFLEERSLVPRDFTFDTAFALRAFDTRLKETIPPNDFRHPWIQAAPRLFPRERPHRRAVLLTAEEWGLLRSAPGQAFLQ